MRKTILSTFMLLFFINGAHAFECNYVGEQLEIDEPRVKEFVQHLTPQQKVQGITLCDGSVLFKGWVFLRKVAGLDPSQYVYLFNDGATLRAVAWVNENGKSFDVPDCPYGKACQSMSESGLVISGDVYTWKQVRAGAEVVIIWYPPSRW